MPAFELASEPTFLRNKEYAHAVERQLLHETDGIGEIAGDTGGVIDQQHIKGEGASVRRGQGWLNPGTLETRTRQRCVGYTRVHLTRSIHGPLHTAGSRNLILQ